MTPPLPPGRVLLNRLLTGQQRADLDTRGYFIEHGCRVTVSGSWVSTSDCIHACGNLPVYDQAVAFLLLLRADPAGYAVTANANRTWPRRRTW